MKHCCSVLIFCTAFFIAAYSAAAQSAGENRDALLEESLASFLPEQERTRLMQEGAVIRSLYNEAEAEPLLTPPLAVPQSFAAGWDKGSPAFLIEALYLHKKKQESGIDVPKISRVLRSLSKLRGLEYYSSSRKKMRTLYEDSYVIDNPEAKVRQADPLDSPADDFSVYVLQKDLTFGENIYRYRFYADADSSGFMSTNTSVLKYSVFKAVEPENLQVSVSVTDLGGYLLIHALTRSQFTAPAILRQRVQNSFRTRSEAVYQWFITHYDAERIVP
ncbi:MAG: hypothetical protein P1P65_08675 [Treponema sp.]